MLRRISPIPVLAFALVLATTLSLPEAGTADVSFGPKVSSQLAAVASAPGVTASTPLHAIIYGSNLPAANTDLGSAMQVRQPLGAIGGESVTIPVGSLPALTAEAGVSYATLDPGVQVDGSTTKAPLGGSALITTYPQTDDVLGAWKSGITGSGVGVAVVDSGTTPESDFQLPNRLDQVQLEGQQGGNGALNDPYGHGTFVAGVVGGYSADGHFIGIAPGSQLEALNISRPDGVRSSDVIAALLWVLAHHKDKHIGVVNLSLTETTTSSYLSDTLDAVVEKLWANGIVVVVSAGNLGPGTTSHAPANDPFVISVGATDTTTPGVTSVASFSSSGLTQDGISKPEILAPGRRIGSLLPTGTVLDGQAPTSARLQSGYVQMSGTSFSAPQVSGAVALLLQANPKLTPDQIKALLVQTEAPVSGSSVGTLDVGAALALAANPPSARQTWQPARWGASGTPAPQPVVVPPPTPSLPGVMVPAPAPTTFTGSPKPSVTAAKCGSSYSKAQSDDAAAQKLPSGTAASTLAPAWEKAASDWEQCPEWVNAAQDYAQAAATWDTAAAPDKGGNDWQKSAVDYERAAAWDNATVWGSAASAWAGYAADLETKGGQLDKAAAAWDSAAGDWIGAGNSAASSAASANGAGDWTQFATASQAQATAPGTTPSQGNFEHAAAAWDSAGFDATNSGAGGTTTDFLNGANDYAKGAQLSSDPNRKYADQKAAALRYDTVASAYETTGSWSAAATLWQSSANSWSQVTNVDDQTANTLQGSANQSNGNTGAWAKAAASLDVAAGEWQSYAGAAQNTAADFERAAAWDKAAAAWDQSTAEWNRAGNDFSNGAAAWTSAGNTSSAATDTTAGSAALTAQGAAYLLSGADWNSFSGLDTGNSSRDIQNAVGEYQNAAQMWQRAAAWDKSADAWSRAAAAWDGTAAWDKGAGAWELTAAAWDRAAAWDKGAAAWDNAGNDWANDLQLANAGGDLNSGGDDWAGAGKWDSAAFDWSLAGTDNPPQPWDTSNSSTDAAAWDAAAWDAAAWG